VSRELTTLACSVIYKFNKLFNGTIPVAW